MDQSKQDVIWKPSNHTDPLAAQVLKFLHESKCDRTDSTGVDSSDTWDERTKNMSLSLCHADGATGLLA